ncbi:TRAP dicarboxylate transporter, DctM subunit [uncultured delta proteobacterium]|uniref:TRAP dicarboxylate transporter, DctM subunit n=1 Tax=uncultured delta proteobacterium TaxID=34034 RepID=A0A212JCZ6_9DELT|nr:TRAP dicarboxylate transporter, DctM subunit [uncultured delta proteobacterium]
MELTALITILLILAVLLGSGLWIGPTLFITGWIALTLFTDLPVLRILGSVVWNNVNSSSLMALPLFIMMGEFLVRSRISDDLFEGLTPWVAKLPGGLLHVNVIASALFAAITGSVNATTATVGKITIPEFRKRGYDESLSIGSLASSGTLGILIPPSVPMLIYGVAANVSIGKLFIAGIVPGIILMFCFCLYLGVMAVIRHENRITENFTWGDRLRRSPKIVPVIVLIAFVLGSIYAGWATPTEAAAIGVLGSMILGVGSGCMTFKIFTECLVGTVKTNCMVMLILIGASFFSVSLGFLGLPKWISATLVSYGASKFEVILLITCVYLFLGCLIDGYSMIVMTVPMFLPLMEAYNMDPIWYGIFVILLVQVANITPPVGFNLFLVTGLAHRSIGFISKAVLPFIGIIGLFVALITIFPEIVLFLPGMMGR